MTSANTFHVIIVGAGLAGIGTACRLKLADPTRSFVVLEARSTLGGTWDLFRFPGARSDSDMETLGFAFRPWRGEHSIVAGGDILDYIRDTAHEYGIDGHIEYDHRVTAAEWSSESATWTLHVANGLQDRELRCNFLVVSTGYFDFAQAHAPAFAGQESFAGEIVHPQFWPQNLDHSGQRIVVIGSGATAVTLVPALAEQAAHVTMLQRSPSYVVARSRNDPFAQGARRMLPARAADWIIRCKNILASTLAYDFARRRPGAMRGFVRAGIKRELGPEYAIDRHFGPEYQPWDQRVCLAADGDFFAALRSGKATVVTDKITHLTPEGLLLASGERLAADLIVTATGLELKLLGGMTLTVDGQLIDIAERLIYRGAMIESVPNLAFSFGYTNNSWSLKSDLTARYVARLLRYMARTGKPIVVPGPADPGTLREPFVTLQSGYVRRAARLLPKRGPAPWRSARNYWRDIMTMLMVRLDDGVLKFKTSGRGQAGGP